MIKWAATLAVPVSIVMALVASSRDASANPTASDELLGAFFWMHLVADFALTLFVIWLGGKLALFLWRTLRRVRLVER